MFKAEVDPSFFFEIELAEFVKWYVWFLCGVEHSGTGVGMWWSYPAGGTWHVLFMCAVLCCHPRHPVSPGLFPMNYLVALYRTCVYAFNMVKCLSRLHSKLKLKKHS